MLGVLYVRAIEASDQSWHCRLGLTELDSHETLEAALVHLRAVGESEADGIPFEIVTHPLVGPPQFIRGDAIAHIGRDSKPA